MMAQHNKGQPLAYRQKVVNLPKVVKHRGTGRRKSPQSLIAPQGSNDGGQLKPERRPCGIIPLDNLGSCSPETPFTGKVHLEETGSEIWYLECYWLGNRETELL